MMGIVHDVPVKRYHDELRGLGILFYHTCDDAGIHAIQVLVHLIQHIER